ncbi:MAG TPA: class I SAM-dependent methyltransferase [Candidatus Binataceae bacterium]|nr:class I SAM-dependent methyltransferase [Candidatus Binataceae bacterium]
MYTKSAAFYDAIYSFKNYPAEAAQLHSIIRKHKRSPGKRLLDMACGTGQHIHALRAHQYEAVGLDLEENLLAVARKRNPGVTFHCADMLDFDLGATFDVVTCLFSAIGYMTTVDRMRRAVANMARHLVPGGVLIVEPWFSPDVPLDPLGSLSVDLPDLKVARIISTQITGNLYVAHFHYLIGKPGGVDYLVERHELGLFTLDENRNAFEAVGLETTHDPKGLIGRGLWIGTKPIT